VAYILTVTDIIERREHAPTHVRIRFSFPQAMVQIPKSLDTGQDTSLALSMTENTVTPCLVRPYLDSEIHPKFYYAKRRFPITSKRRQMYEVLNVDEIIN
jgi:hypothetical protein